MRLRCALSQLSKQHEPHRHGCTPGHLHANSFAPHVHLPPLAAGAASVGQPRPAGPVLPCRWVGRTARLGVTACACPVGLPPHWRLLQACRRPAHHLGACLALLLPRHIWPQWHVCYTKQAHVVSMAWVLHSKHAMLTCELRRPLPCLLQGCSRSLPGWRSCANSLSTPQTSRMCGL